MTVTSTTYKNQYTGNGSQTTFAYGFKIFADSEISVYQADTLKTISTHYTVTNAGNDAGGNIVFTTAPASGENVTLIRSIPYTQTADYTAYDPFKSETHETALDKGVMHAQQLLEKHDRTVKMKPSFTGSEVLVDAPTANKALKWDATGTKIINSTDDVDGITASASASATSASASATSASASLDAFTDQYLGSKSTDPSTDNDGDALATGALYFNTTNNVMMTYTGSAWVRTTPTTTDQGHINTVSGISANVTTVAGISADVSAVSAKSTEVSRLGTADAVADMALLATTDCIGDMNTLGTADVVSDMNTLGTSGNVTNMNTLAGIASAISTCATNEASINRYSSEYTISTSTPSSPSSGDLWYDSNSGVNQLKYYDGSSWIGIAAGITSETDPSAIAMAIAL